MSQADETENDDLEPQRELTQNEKNLLELQNDVGKFVNKYTKADELPDKPIINHSHLGKVVIMFNPGDVRVAFLMRCMPELGAAYVRCADGTLREPEKVAELTEQTARALWGRAEKFQ